MANTTYEISLASDGPSVVTVRSDEPTAATAAATWARDLLDTLLAWDWPAGGPARPIADTPLTTVEAWEQTLAAMREEVTGPIFHLCLKPTDLIACENGTALIAAASRYQIEELQQRQLDRRLGFTLGRIIGSPVACRFMVASDMLGEDHPSDSAAGPGSPASAHPTGAALV